MSLALNDSQSALYLSGTNGEQIRMVAPAKERRESQKKIAEDADVECEELFLQVQKKYQDTVPYAKAIQKTKEILNANSSPCAKLLGLHEIKKAIFQDIEDFWLSVDMQGEIPNEASNFDKGEMLTILNFILMQAEISDLSSQFTFMKEFSSQYVQEGQDGADISQNYADFSNSVLWLTNIEADKILQEGPDYI